MASEGNAGRRVSPWRVAAWSIVALLLLLPLVAMQLTNEVNWTAGDFIFAALMFGTVGGAFELAVRTTRSWTQRAAVAAALAGGFLTVWANGAVGMIGSEDNPYNLLFLGVILLALLGSVVARFRPSGMVYAMSAAAVAQAALGLYGIQADPLGGMFSTAFAGIWAVSAALFMLASREDGRATQA
jgi:hypothetical protein